MTPTRTPLVVILSPERSGSTLLSVLLGGHPRIAAPPELHLFRYPDLTTWRRAYPPAWDSLRSALATLAPEVDPERFFAEQRAAPPEAVTRRLLEYLPSGSWLVDKTPAYARDDIVLRRLERLEPRYVWLARHPLGVAASRLDLRDRRLAQRTAETPAERLRLAAARAWVRAHRATRRDLREVLRYWTDVHRRLERFLAGVPVARRRLVKFADLVGAPERTLGSLCDWLGLDFEPSMLEVRRNIPTHLAGKIGDEKIRRHAGIDPAVADRWRARYPDRLPAATRAVWARLDARGPLV